MTVFDFSRCGHRLGSKVQSQNVIIIANEVVTLDWVSEDQLQYQQVELMFNDV